MLSKSWLDKRKPYWIRLEQLVEKSGRRGISVLTGSELQEIGLLYRQAAADLSTVREDPTGEQLARYLNQLLGHAHNLIYMGRKAKAKGILAFYRDTYPRLFRATLPYTFAAFTLFLLAALAAWLVSLRDPAFARYVLGPHMMETIERRQMWTHSIVSIKPVASSAILTNNLSVAFSTFAMGITAGLGTVYMMLLNGLLIGVVAAACWQAGMSLQLWGFVAPHGVLELPAIFIAGGAGLLMARGLLFPGWMPRKDSLVAAGGQAVQLFLGAVPLLLVAGFIEGFLSPVDISPVAKFLFAFAMAFLLFAYLMRAHLPRKNPRAARGP